MVASDVERQALSPRRAAGLPDTGGLTDDIGGYVVGANAPAASRRVAARDVLRNGRDDYCRAVRSATGSAGVAVDVVLDRDGRRIWAGQFGAVPSALALLYLCWVAGRAGDVVHIRTRGPIEGVLARSLRWPFDLEDADLLVGDLRSTRRP